MAKLFYIRRLVLAPAAVGFMVYGYKMLQQDEFSEQRHLIKSLQAATPTPSPGEIPSREKQLQSLMNTPEFDVLIIGGGATGAGVALDAQTRGLKTALVEGNDFASGTSSKSTKLIHGGVRYLQKAVFNLDYQQYKMVREALSERGNMVHSAPHLTYALPIMIPVYKWYQIPFYYSGLVLYDLIAGSQCLQRSYVLFKTSTLEKFPMLKKENLKGSIVYYDGAQNDSRMNVTIALTAMRYGANVLNHVKVVSLIKDGKGRVRGAICKEQFTGKEFPVKAKCVVNATGPFTDSIRLMDDPKAKKICQGSSGVHITLPEYYCPKDMGLLDPQTSDGRVIFFLPWENHAIAGTTDRPCPTTENPAPTEEDIDFILNEIRHYFSPVLTVRRGDVLSAWSGIRPLVLDLNKPPGKTEALARNHIIYVSDSGLVTIAGGKWTTYREMAEDTVDKCIESRKDDEKLQPKEKHSVTKGMLLEGTEGWNPLLYIRLAQDYGLDLEVAKHLSHNYGGKAFKVAALASMTNKKSTIIGKRLNDDLPFIEAEVRYAARKEFACTVVDVIARRLRLAFLNVEAAYECIPTVVEIMAEELGWDQSRMASETQDAKKFLDVEMGGGLNRASMKLELLTKEEIAEYTGKFRSLDTDNKGFISVMDVKSFLKDIKMKLSANELHEILNEVDVRKNGKIELEEFLEVMSVVKGGKNTATRYSKSPFLRSSRKSISVVRSGGGV